MAGLSYREFLELKLGRSFPAFSLETLLSHNVELQNSLYREFVPLEYFGEYLQKGYYPFYFKEQNYYLSALHAVINLTIDVDLVNLGLVHVNFTHTLNLARIGTYNQLSFHAPASIHYCTWMCAKASS